LVCSKNKNDTQERVRKCIAQKTIVVATQVQEVVTLERVIRLAPNRNLQQYEGQPQKTITRILRRMALFSIEQVKGVDFALQQETFEKFITHPLV